MIVADAVLGTVAEFAGREVETVRLDDHERKRSRVRATTDAGTEIGLALGDARVREGDVVYADDERVVAVAFEEREALVVALDGVDGSSEALASMAELGHVVGNRHRDLAVRGGELLFPIGGSGDRIADEVRGHLPAGATTRREAVDPTLFDEGAAGADHEHGPHSRSHGGHEHREADE